jgi:CO/xanthine dehydrogenase Mo-binding subunit/aerobic-type carbon monoxide dehydrogenase small subunit (CoxS/CutS family)
VRRQGCAAYGLLMVRFIVNGTERAVEAASGRTLLAALRDDFGLTGAKYGCGEGQCGACTVLVDGTPARACITDLDDIDGADVTTVEGLAADGALHPVQRAFVEARALQCGYCTPGMVMSAVALLARDPAAGDAAVAEALAGNVCRCGGYPRILQAVTAAAAAVRADPNGARVDRVESGPATVAVEQHDGAVWTVLPALGGDGSVEQGWGWSTPGGARLVIDSDGRVHAVVGKVDGGQGNRYSLIRLVAAEIGVPTSRVQLEMGDTELSPLDLGTFGSRSTPDAGRALRLVAAAARRALLAEAATRWERPVERLRAAGGEIRDDAADRVISYGALVATGSRTLHVHADEQLPAAPPNLVDLDDSAVRRGLVAAVTGTKRFPSDLTAPGMLHGRVLRPPGFGALPRTVDTSAARRMPGVTVVEHADLIAVAAPTREAATQALRSIEVDWQPSSGPAEAELESYLRSHPVEHGGWGGAVEHEIGDLDTARAHADIVLEATYTTAYLAHVPLEPRVALARVDGGALTVWVGTQRPFAVRSAVAAAVGVAEEHVRVIVPDFGGGFGGKHSADVAVEAARLARATGRPVKVAWTRAEEFRHAYFRPAAVIDVRSAADGQGTLTGWEFTNINSGAAALLSPYQVANQRVRFQPAESPLPQGSYRALAATANNFARESHMDEVAHAAGVDAIELRLRHLRDERLKAVLTTVAERVGWPGRPGGDTGIGVACGVEKDARVATAALLHAGADGRLELERIVTAFDCGAVIDSNGLRNQIVGATIMGLGGALFEAIRFDAGRILNPSFTDYRVPCFADVPPIDVVILDRPGVESAGAGETPIIAIAPAIANAIHAATGRRVRSLPLSPGGAVG